MRKFMLAAGFMFAATMSFAQDLKEYSNKDKKWGWKDERGKKVVIDAIYEDQKGFDKETGRATVKLDGKWGMIDKSGATVLPFEYEEIGSLNSKNGWMRAKKGGKYGLMDKDGKETVPMKYDDMYSSSYGEMYFAKMGGKWGMVDLAGKELTEMKYDRLVLIGINPYVYKATLGSQAVRLSATGVEEEAIAAAGSSTSSGDAKKEAGSGKQKHKFTCAGCGAVEIMEGSARPSPNKTHCRSPKTKNSTSHSWDYSGKVK